MFFLGTCRELWKQHAAIFGNWFVLQRSCQRLYNLAANVLVGAMMLAWVGVLCGAFRYADAPDLDEDDGGRRNASISVAGGLTLTFAKVLCHHWLHTSECSSPPVLVCVHARV